MPRTLWVLLLTLAGVAAGQSQTVNFNEHIAPIIYNNCSSCHRPNQIGPFPLLSYDDVRKKALTIAAVTGRRYMPPWKPEPGWVDYRDERHLTAEQIALIQKWVADGAPEGPAAKAVPPPVFTDGWQLGTPDLVLELPAAFPVPPEGPDIYRNFVVPTGLTEDKWVTAIELKPTARPVLHHALFFGDASGTGRKLESQTKDGLPGFSGFGSIFTAPNDVEAVLAGGLGGWVPGTTPKFWPGGLAVPLKKGSDLLIQAHFHPNGLAYVEKTVIGLYFGPKPSRTMTQVQVPGFFGINARIDIPAGAKDYKLRASYVLPVDVEAVTVSSHMHYLAKGSKLTATLPSGEVKILLWIRDWDINWQDSYNLKDPMPLPRGTRLDGEILYDNSADNPRNPSNPPKQVKWGEQSTDEMGSLILNVVTKEPAELPILQGSTVSYVIVGSPAPGNRPIFLSAGTVDAASAQPGALTPGKIIVLYGSRMGPASLTTAAFGTDGKLATNLGGTQVTFDGTPAPLLYTSGGQVSVVVPYGIDGQRGTQVVVRNGTNVSDPVAFPVTPVAPSIFSTDYSGTGQGAILNQDGITVNSAARPAERGSVVSIFATGEGQTMPGGIDGAIANGGLLPKPTRDVRVWMNGRPAEVTYAGAAPGQVAGLFQVNARVPGDLPPGEIPVEIQVGDSKSQPGITIAVR